MAKYVSKKFSPFIYPDWGEIFKTMDSEQRSEVLMAITCFPNYEPQGVPLWGFFKSQLQNQYDTWEERSEIYRSNAKSRKSNDSEENQLQAVGGNSEQLLPVATNSKQLSVNRTVYKQNCNRTEKKDTYASSPSASDASLSTTDVKKPEGVTADQWKRYKKLRKDKRLPLTVEAWDLIKLEADKAGKTLPEVVTICLQNSWAGFKASWLEKLNTDRNGCENFDMLQFALDNPGLIDDPETIPGYLEAIAAREKKNA